MSKKKAVDALPFLLSVIKRYTTLFPDEVSAQTRNNCIIAVEQNIECWSSVIALSMDFRS